MSEQKSSEGLPGGETTRKARSKKAAGQDQALVDPRQIPLWGDEAPAAAPAPSAAPVDAPLASKASASDTQAKIDSLKKFARDTQKAAGSAHSAHNPQAQELDLFSMFPDEDPQEPAAPAAGPSVVATGATAATAKPMAAAPQTGLGSAPAAPAARGAFKPGSKAGSFSAAVATGEKPDAAQWAGEEPSPSDAVASRAPTATVPAPTAFTPAVGFSAGLAQPRSLSRAQMDAEMAGFGRVWSPKEISDDAFAQMGIAPFDPKAIVPITDFESILFVGDPHMVSAERAPGRRLDAAKMPEVVADKLMQAGAISRARRARMAILGDFFDQADDNGLAMLTLSVKALGQAGHQPMTLVGNHEKLHERLTDNTALGLVRAAGALSTLEGNALFEVFEIDGQFIGLGGSGHGNEIPKDLRELKAALGLDTLIWMTHHDLAFGGAYPGAAPIEEIQGVDLLVNGHMHLFKKPETRGGMVAWNPGNITRMEIGSIEHEPAVWLWTPARKQHLEKIPLQYQKDVFNRAGKMTVAAKGDEEAARAELAVEESLFAQMLREQDAEGRERTTDASELWEDMREIFEDRGAPAAVRMALVELLRESLGGFLPSTARSFADIWSEQAKHEEIPALPPMERSAPKEAKEPKAKKPSKAKADAEAALEKSRAAQGSLELGEAAAAEGAAVAASGEDGDSGAQSVEGDGAGASAEASGAAHEGEGEDAPSYDYMDLPPLVRH